MSDQYEVLERSLLGDHTGLVASNSETGSATEQHPYLYLCCLAAIGLLGYAFLLLFPLTFIALAIYVPGAIIEASNKLDVVLVLSSIGVASAAAWVSWYLYKVRPSLPSGRPLKHEEAPLLFDFIDSECRSSGSPRIHMIKIVRDYHIEVIRTPKNGYPLSYTNTLLIGLPVFQSLSPKQLGLAINRELAHLRGTYRRSSGWFYFLEKTWCQYRLSHQNGWHPASIIIRGFFCWYAPLFKLLAQTACREEQFYADHAISKTDKNFTLIDMLARQSIHARYLEEDFWPRLLNKAYRFKTPPYLPYASIEKNLSSRLDNETAQRLLDASMTEQSRPSAMPGLKQRLQRLGIHTVLLPEAGSQAASQYFSPDALALIIRQMDKLWLTSSQHDWQRKFRTGQQEQNKLKELQLQAKQGLLSDIKTWEYIQLIKKYFDDDKALPLYREVLKIDTDDARISYDIGRSMLKHLDHQGIAALEQAINKDASYTVMACQLITQFFVRIGDKRSAQMYRRKALAYQVEAA